MFDDRSDDGCVEIQTGSQILPCTSSMTTRGLHGALAYTHGVHWMCLSSQWGSSEELQGVPCKKSMQLWAIAIYPCKIVT